MNEMGGPKLKMSIFATPWIPEFSFSIPMFDWGQLIGRQFEKQKINHRQVKSTTKGCYIT